VNARLVPDRWLRRWPGRVLAGGSPWRLMRLAPTVQSTMDDVCTKGSAADGRVVAALVDRGILHPRPSPRSGPHDVTVVVPAFGQPDVLARCLSALAGLDVIVVDDASPKPLQDIAVAAGARYIRLPENRGPAAARNAGLSLVGSGLVAFVDSDCQPQPGWLDRLVPFFDDPRVALVAPRIVPGPGGASVVSRFESAASSLDMGRHPALVRPTARLGFVPSAALLARRDVAQTYLFDERMRLGEDVDLVWRLADAGYHVRYEPTVTVRHNPRRSVHQWAGRRFEYGTSAVDLADRHPGRLAPVRVSPWNLAALGLLGFGRPGAALATSALATGLLARQLRRQHIGPAVAARVVAVGVAADALAIGHALRREYWPLGALAVAAAPRSRLALLATGLMVGPVLAEWVRLRPPLDPVRFTALRLLADGAYGSGVLASSLRRRSLVPLRPGLRPKTSRTAQAAPPQAPRPQAPRASQTAP
jgi:mycofactocin system glycosyltransferase